MKSLPRCSLLGLSALTLSLAVTGRAADSPLTTESGNGAEWIVKWKGQTVCVYTYGADQMKPYIRELYTLRGDNVLRDSPADHKHHHALMYGIKVNDVNFWEETPGCGLQKPILEPTRRLVKGPGGIPCASFSQTLLWVTAADAPKAATPTDALLVEQRQLTVGVDEAQREVAVRWYSEFALGGKATSATLGGANYHGLGARFLQELDPLATHYVAGKPVDTSGSRQDLSKAPWAAVVFDRPNKPATFVMAGNPANARGDSTFFAMKQPFAYLSATQALDKEPITHPATGRWKLGYAVLVYPEAKIPENLGQRLSLWFPPGPGSR